VRLLRGGLVAGALVVVLLTAGIEAPSRGQSASVEITILFDLGDGVTGWSELTILDPTAVNASWDATKAAAAQLGLRIESGWFGPEFGVGVFDIGDRDPPSGFPGLFVWNRTIRSWDLAPIGISSLVLRDGDAIAWYNAAFDSVDFSLRAPVATPDSPYPSAMFRGNTLNRGASASPAPDSATLMWDQPLGVIEIGSTPTVAYGQVFVTTLEGLYALSAETGQVLWSNADAKGISSPVAFDRTVIVGSSNGSLYRLDATTGAERWSVPLVGSSSIHNGIKSSPKVAFDKVYVGTFNDTGGGTGEVVALWASNGTVAWRRSTGSVHLSSPAVVGEALYIGVMGRCRTTLCIEYDPPFGLLALDAADGAERWLFRTGGPVAASPAVDGLNVVVASKDGRAYAINRVLGTEVWRAEVGEVAADVSSPAVLRNVVYVGGGVFGGAVGRMTALNATTGAVVWGVPVNGPVQSSPSVAAGKVFFSTNTQNGTIYALAATTGAVVWTYRPDPAQFILGSPVVADGTVFAVSDNGYVYAFRAPPPAGGLDAVTLAIVISLVFVAAVVPITIVMIMLRRRLRGRA